MRRSVVASLAAVVVSATGCGAKPAADYRESGQLEQAVKAQLDSEGKSATELACLKTSGLEFACAYKLASGFAAVRHVMVAPDGKTWSSG